ncbi:MAG: hypothetical protein K0R31_20 [Clostridiales bacterium]|jgi:N-acetylmuramoyl-L-alanine amidase|nr:hypothetical protein [Clostridiales bacterium]
MRSRKVFILTTFPSKKHIVMSLLLILPAILLSAVIITHVSDKIMSGKSLIIDAGHGGVDSGANDGISFFEKDITLAISLKLQKALAANKANADLTRSTDIALDHQNNLSTSRHTRDLLARINRFNSGKYDLFVSIHVNRSSSPKAMGPIVLYNSNIAKSAILARCIQDRLNNLAENVLGSTAIHRPVLYDYFILKNSKIPGVIVETGFLSNYTEKKFLMDDYYQQRLSSAIAEGIEDYYISIDKYSNETIPENDDSKPFNTINEAKIVIN